MKPYELIPHTADLRILVHGKSLKELFENALHGMFEAKGARPTNQICKNRPIRADGPTTEDLLVDFLSDALAMSDTNNEVYERIEWKSFSETEAQAVLSGRKVSRFDLDIKAVTYHDLEITEDKDGFHVDIVFDI